MLSETLLNCLGCFLRVFELFFSTGYGHRPGFHCLFIPLQKRMDRNRYYFLTQYFGRNATIFLPLP